MTTRALERPRPDWNLWRQIPTVKAFEAVALSLDIDPKTVRRVDLKAANEAIALRDDRIGLMAKQWALLNPGGPCVRFVEESEEFNERFEVTVRTVEELPSAGGASHDHADRLVRLSEFAAFAQSNGWKIPDGLKELAGGDDGVKMAVIQRAYDDIHADTGKPPSQRAVTKRAGYDRATVRARWSRLKT
jgi:hypothetical protein